MKSILICGANGQLGKEINSIADLYPEFNFLFTDIDELDITDLKEIDSFFKSNNIDILINCAAYTDVDKAEDEPKDADRINSLAVKYLANISKKYGSKMIHISTDYVFDGKAKSPYSEDNMTNPQTVYGKTKLEGENHFIESGVTGFIIRTSWLYSSFGKNFVKTISNLSKIKDELRVVDDQKGSPTNAKNLAKAILDILSINDSIFPNKIYHFSNEDSCSWYDFASEIIKYIKSDCKVIPVDSEEFPTKAKRPKYSVMNKSLIKSDFSITIANWKDSLHNCLDKI